MTSELNPIVGGGSMWHLSAQGFPQIKHSCRTPLNNLRPYAETADLAVSETVCLTKSSQLYVLSISEIKPSRVPRGTHILKQLRRQGEVVLHVMCVHFPQNDESCNSFS